MSSKVIKITKKTRSRTEQMEMVISILCLVSGIRLSNTAISVLAHFVAFGMKKATDTLLINSKIVADIQALRNMKTLLLKKGFLRRTTGLYKTYELNLDDQFKAEDVISLYIKLDNK